MPPGLLPAACRAWGTVRILWQCGGRGLACALFAPGAEAAGGAARSSAWARLAAGAVRRARGPRGEGGGEVGKGLPGAPAVGTQRVAHQGLGGDAPVLGRQRRGGGEGRQARSAAVWRAHVVGPDASLQGGASARGAAWRGGPRRSKAQPMRGAVSCNQGSTCGPELFTVLVRRVGRRPCAPPTRRRGATRCARARLVRRGGWSGWRVSRGVRRRSSGRSASVGSSVARLGGTAARARATVSGGLGPRPSTASWRKAPTRGPVWRARQRAPGGPCHRVRRGVAPASRAAGGCARWQPSRGVAPAAWRPPSWVASAPSRPTNAAQGWGACCLRRPLPAYGRGASGTGRLPGCAGRRGSRWCGSPCGFVRDRQRPRGGAERCVRLTGSAGDRRPLRGPVPAVAESDLPAVLRITDSRTVDL
jgi:hypothetical protein